MIPCRCGHAGDGPHPCHWALDGKTPYTCRAPATMRLAGSHFASLAGAQMKVVAHETWACDEHWAQYVAMTADSRREA